MLQQINKKIIFYISLVIILGTFNNKNLKNFDLPKINMVNIEGIEFNDNEYLKVLKETIPKVIDQFEPEFIFYLSGVDVLQNDKLGRLSLTLNGCKERDKFILQTCKDNSIPLQVSMGGGYSIVLKNIIEAHSNTFRLAQEIFF